MADVIARAPGGTYSLEELRAMVVAGRREDGRRGSFRVHLPMLPARPRGERRRNQKRANSVEVLADAFEYTAEDLDALARRPRTRAECENGQRPCPWFGCRHHLGLDVSPETGSLKFAYGEGVDQPETCSLDVAERGPTTLEEVGIAMNVTRERVRQIETKSAFRMRAELVRARIREDVLDGSGDSHDNFEGIT